MDVTDLASLAANTVVAAAVTDTFEGVRERVARLFGRGTPDPAITRRLDVTRTELSNVTPAGAERVRVVQATQWQVRFADLLDAYPAAAGELAQLVAERQSEQPAHGNVANVITGGAQHGPILMGRDFTGITLHPDQGSAESPRLPSCGECRAADRPCFVWLRSVPVPAGDANRWRAYPGRVSRESQHAAVHSSGNGSPGSHEGDSR